MGLFSRKPACAVCGGKIPRRPAGIIEGEQVCGTCFEKIDMDGGRASRLTMREFRSYLDFYERNRKLREKFIVSERFEFGFDTKIIFDSESRLFCMSERPDKTVFEGKHLKFFVIGEDDAPLFEGSEAGILRCPSAVPERAAAMLGRAAQPSAGGQASHEAGRTGAAVNSPAPGQDTGIQEPFSSFRVELQLEHPYWSVIRFDMAGPRFDGAHPDLGDYLCAYRACLEEIVRLVRALKEVAFPDALEQLTGFYDNAGLPLRDAPRATNIEEIRKYKALFDDGVITEQEFREKKRLIMGL
jgi:hypothetical protein